jgi:hypothetical protein
VNSVGIEDMAVRNSGNRRGDGVSPAIYGCFSRWRGSMGYAFALNEVKDEIRDGSLVRRYCA